MSSDPAQWAGLPRTTLLTLARPAWPSSSLQAPVLLAASEENEDAKEEEALFDAAVLLQYTALMNDDTTISFLNTAEANVGGGAIGSPPTMNPPTNAEIRREQEAHPATCGLLEYLQMGELSIVWGRVPKLLVPVHVRPQRV